MAAATVLVAGAGASANSDSVPAEQASSTSLEAVSKTEDQIQNFTQAAWHWDDVLGQAHVHFGYHRGDSTSLKYVRWVLKQRQAVSHRLHAKAKRVMVKRTKVRPATAYRLRLELGLTNSKRDLTGVEGPEARLNQARRLVQNLHVQWHNSPLFKAFSCIHGYEGSWTDNTGNGYYGGVQMDIGFQKLYGAEFLHKWGTANNWPVWAQFVAAVRAYRSGRGFWPWPNSARICGLL